MTDLPVPVAGPDLVGQGTAIEQSRAVAEVQAAVVVAHRMPRQIAGARDRLRQTCEQYQMAEQAFWRFRRGDGVKTGVTVHLARELARCWGNLQHGMAELRRDDTRAESEMLAFCWDLETNVRAQTVFIVPHKRDRSEGGPVVLSSMRDIYENNANQAARRLRVMILDVIPPWYVAEAETICRQTLERGDGTASLGERVERAIQAFDQLGVETGRLERKLGRPVDRWDGFDLAQLTITKRSIERGEITADDEFPAPRITTADLGGAPPAAPIEETPAQPPEDEPGTPGPDHPNNPPGANDDGDPAADQPATAGPPTLDEFREMAKRKTTALIKAVQRAHPDRAGELATLDAIWADPQALDTALFHLEAGR